MSIFNLCFLIFKLY